MDRVGVRKAYSTIRSEEVDGKSKMKRMEVEKLKHRTKTLSEGTNSSDGDSNSSSMYFTPQEEELDDHVCHLNSNVIESSCALEGIRGFQEESISIEASRRRQDRSKAIFCGITCEFRCAWVRDGDSDCQFGQ